MARTARIKWKLITPMIQERIRIHRECRLRLQANRCKKLPSNSTLECSIIPLFRDFFRFWRAITRNCSCSSVKIISTKSRTCIRFQGLYLDMAIQWAVFNSAPRLFSVTFCLSSRRIQKRLASRWRRTKSIRSVTFWSRKRITWQTRLASRFSKRYVEWCRLTTTSTCTWRCLSSSYSWLWKTRLRRILVSLMPSENKKRKLQAISW